MRLLLLNLDPPEQLESAHSLGRLEVICRKYDTQVVSVAELSDEAVARADVLLVAGGLHDAEASRAAWYKPLVAQIQTASKPVLGIGLGFELVGAAFGAVLTDIGELAEGAPVVTPTEDGAKLFQGTDPLRVREIARWLVAREDLPKALQVLAASETGVEAVRHKTLPVYALQLYPEDFTYPSDGKLVYENILSALHKAAPTAQPA